METGGEDLGGGWGQSLSSEKFSRHGMRGWLGREVAADIEKPVLKTFRPKTRRIFFENRLPIPMNYFLPFFCYITPRICFPSN